MRLPAPGPPTSVTIDEEGSSTQIKSADATRSLVRLRCAGDDGKGGQPIL